MTATRPSRRPMPPRAALLPGRTRSPIAVAAGTAAGVGGVQGAGLVRAVRGGREATAAQDVTP